MPDAGEVEKVIVVPAQISSRAAAVVERMKLEFGVTQKAGVEMGLEFLGSLPPTVLREVFRRGGDPISELVKLKLAEAAGASDATTIEQAAAIAKMQIGRLEQIATSYRRELEDAAGQGKSKKQSGKTGG